MQINVSVRELVEFLYRSGDIDRTRGSSSAAPMAEGSRIHKMLQAREGAAYRAEVPLCFLQRGEDYDILLEGRADGIIEGSDGFMVDEIKGTYRDVSRIESPVAVHLAQAKCYAFMYRAEEYQEEAPGIIRIRITYCNMDTNDTHRIIEEYSAQEIEDWFYDTLRAYRKWTDIEYEGRIRMGKTGTDVPFPFDYRPGQKKLMGQVYTTMKQGKKLFLQAPTGTGKTLAVLYPAIKAASTGLCERIFYLTARTTGRSVAREALTLLIDKGLYIRYVELNARERICFMDHAECDPASCLYARGHFDRVNDVLYSLISENSIYDTETVMRYAGEGEVCPFELSLDASLFSHCIIGDYNYAFDPEAALQRFFGEGAVGKNMLLVDEAHNLLDRGRDMYSAAMSEDMCASLRSVFIKRDRRISSGTGRVKKLLAGLMSPAPYTIVDLPETLINELQLIFDRLGSFFEKTAKEKRTGHISPGKGITREEMNTAMEFYFELGHFLNMEEEMDGDYQIYTHRNESGSGELVLFCTDPSKKLGKRMEKAAASILFSATLLPIQYYKSLLGGRPEDYEVYALSSFDPQKAGIFIAGDVTTRYDRRGPKLYDRMAGYIHAVLSTRKGHYLAFFPSYRFMHDVYDVYMEEYYDAQETEVLIQSSDMQQEERDMFLEAFRVPETPLFPEALADIPMEIETEDKNLLGFCVLGGIFSEGIDLRGESLIGVMVAGTGTPMVCNERELLKRYFDDRSGRGFDYSYRFPGMNKVLQAAGRLIRTAQDCGIILLMDERFSDNSYRRLFPREWAGARCINLKNAEKNLSDFWFGSKNICDKNTSDIVANGG